MTSFQKVATLVVAGAIITSLILPGRQTANILNVGLKGSSNILKTVQGR